MKEITDILNAYALARKAGLRAALATVVKVEGSSYRRPGARMLVTEDGRLTGAISGGCLEGDARRKALFAMERQENKLVTYDSTEEEGELFGIQLGCNGVVHILFEPIGARNPLAMLEALDDAQAACLVTLFEEHRPDGRHIGTCLMQQEGKAFAPETLPSHLCDDARQTLTRKISTLKQYTVGSTACSALLAYLPPAVTLTIAGAGNDAVPLAQMAALLGWKITVVDGRPAYAAQQRFPMARVRVVTQHESPPPACLYMLMSHNYPYDLAMLRHALRAECRYIGILGPSAKRERMLAELEKEGMQLTALQRQRVHGPAGLDIGAETAEEIALSILAEMQAALHDASAAALRDKSAAIHMRASA